MPVCSAAPIVGLDLFQLVALAICGLALLGCYAAAAWWALRGTLLSTRPMYG